MYLPVFIVFKQRLQVHLLLINFNIFLAHRTGFHALGKAGTGQSGTAQLFDIFRTEDAGNVLRLILERVDIHGFAPLWI